METVVLKGKITSGFTDEEFFWFCQGNKDLRIERNSNLEIYILSPVTSLGANYRGEIFRQMANWAFATQTCFAFDSSAGFTLPDRSVLSPMLRGYGKKSGMYCLKKIKTALPLFAQSL
jgi:Uma2 family endonuclease